MIWGTGSYIPYQKLQTMSFLFFILLKVWIEIIKNSGYHLLK